MSEFFIEAVRDDLNRAANPHEISLQGPSRIRIFQGNQIYSGRDRDVQTGVYLTAKGAIACWHLQTSGDQMVGDSFHVYETLDDFFKDQEWTAADDKRYVKDEIEREYAKLTGRKQVELLDI